MNTKQIRNVDISGIQHLPMIDFIGNDFAIFDDIRDIPFTPYPTRLNAACFAVCRKGWCKLNINLRDYEMREGMLCIILPEQIVQQGLAFIAGNTSETVNVEGNRLLSSDQTAYT